jgi:type I restriction enzyme S subunit
MAVKSGYKQTAAGVVPNDWEAYPLSEDIVLSSGHHILTQHCNSAGIGVPYLTGPADFPNGTIRHTKYTDKPATICDPDDILVTVKGSGAGTLVMADGAYCISRQLMAIKTRKWDKRFIFYSLVQNGSRFRSASTGLIPGLSRSDILEQMLPIPGVREQRDISSALNEVDALIDGLNRIIAKKRDLKQAAMQQLLTGQTRLPGFTGEWVTKLLPQVCQFRSGKAHEQHITDFGQFVCVNSKFIATDGKERKYSVANFCCARKYDILMVMSDLPNGRALAKTYLVEQDSLYAVNQRVCALTPYCDSPQFLSHILNRNPYFLKFDDGVNQTHLLNKVFLNCPILMPPAVAEQTAIAAVLSAMATELKALEERLAKTRNIKQGMMQELLTGKTRLITPEAPDARTTSL